jgi:DnaJ-class molecular chaperone
MKHIYPAVPRQAPFSSSRQGFKLLKAMPGEINKYGSIGRCPPLSQKQKELLRQLAELSGDDEGLEQKKGFFNKMKDLFKE